MKRYTPREYESGPHQMSRGAMHEESLGEWVQFSDVAVLAKMILLGKIKSGHTDVDKYVIPSDYVRLLKRLSKSD